MSPTLGFSGDVMLGRNVDRTHRDTAPEAVWGSALPWLDALDGLFVNLECVLSTRGQEWTRTHRPFHFQADPDWAVPALEAASVDWTALANNHLLDYEERALLDTVEHLDDAGIAHAGAGADVTAATAPSVVEVDGLRVGLLSLTDNTPEYAAGPDSPGVARVEMDVEDADERARVTDSLAALQAQDPDLLVASLHWGPNMVAVPDEAYREFGRWLVDAGVDLIHGHSAHVLQGIERYGDGLLCYDCGDFVDDYRVDPDLCNDRSALFEVDVSPSGDLERLRLRPVEIRGCRVHQASDEAAGWVRDRVRERSRPFGTGGAFEEMQGGGLRLAL